MIGMRGLGVVALGLFAATSLGGCGRGETDLLVAYSGDCQAYIEPCG